jgi:hypothetical protein
VEETDGRERICKMATGERMKVEGELNKPYVLFRLGAHDEPIERLADGDTLEEMNAKHHRRLDWKYGVYHHRKRIS